MEPSHPSSKSNAHNALVARLQKNVTEYVFSAAKPDCVEDALHSLLDSRAFQTEAALQTCEPYKLINSLNYKVPAPAPNTKRMNISVQPIEVLETHTWDDLNDEQYLQSEFKGFIINFPGRTMHSWSTMRRNPADGCWYELNSKKEASKFKHSRVALMTLSGKWPDWVTDMDKAPAKKQDRAVEIFSCWAYYRISKAPDAVNEVVDGDHLGAEEKMLEHMKLSPSPAPTVIDPNDVNELEEKMDNGDRDDEKVGGFDLNDAIGQMDVLEDPMDMAMEHFEQVLDTIAEGPNKTQVAVDRLRALDGIVSHLVQDKGQVIDLPNLHPDLKLKLGDIEHNGVLEFLGLIGYKKTTLSDCFIVLTLGKRLSRDLLNEVRKTISAISQTIRSTEE